MTDRRERLLQEIERISDLWPERKHAAEVADRVAAWLAAEDGTPTCTVRTGGLLVIADRSPRALRLSVSRPAFQVDDSPARPPFGSALGGTSILEPATSLTRVEIPLSTLLEDP